MPTLDLGELGATIEDAIRADDTIVADAAPAGAAPDADRAVAGESAVDPAPVAAATTEGSPERSAEDEAAYKARFEADYQERSKADFAKLRSALDRQVNDWRSRHDRVADERREADGYVEFLETKLAEYDPDEVARYRRNREGFQAQRSRERQAATLELDNRRAFRDREFRRLYPDLDPDEPSLMEAFLAGDARLEAARIEAQLAATALRRAEARPAPAVAPPATPPPAAETPPRDDRGRFVARAEETRRVEAARGAESVAVARGGGFPADVPRTLEAARRPLLEGLARLGLS